MFARIAFLILALLVSGCAPIPTQPSVQKVPEAIRSDSASPTPAFTRASTPTPDPTPEPTPTPIDLPPFFSVYRFNLYVYSGPGMTYPGLGRIEEWPGHVITPTGRKGDWIRFNFKGGEQGWVYAPLLMVHNMDAIPVLDVEAGPTPGPINEAVYRENIYDIVVESHRSWMTETGEWGFDVDSALNSLFDLAALAIETPIMRLDKEWQSEMSFQLGVLYYAHERAQLLTPPRPFASASHQPTPEFKAFHDRFLQGMETCRSSADFMKSALDKYRSGVLEISTTEDLVKASVVRLKACQEAIRDALATYP